jgi:hypothetical protein
MDGVSHPSCRYEKMKLMVSTQRQSQHGEAEHIRRSSRFLPMGRRRVSFILLQTACNGQLA